MEEIEQILQTIELLQGEFEDLAMRGLRATGPQHVAKLEMLRAECQRMGADHLAGRIETLVEAIRNNAREAAAALLRAQSSLRVFERILTLQSVEAVLQSQLENPKLQEPRTKSALLGSWNLVLGSWNSAKAERSKLLATLDQLAAGVEELFLSGLTTASEATRQVLGVAFQEASRLRLLRLSSTLRGANEELGRFTRNEPDFSRRRLSFFLNRSWLLSRGLTRAIKEGDDKEFDKLLWMPASQPVDRLELVSLGIAKKVAAGAFCAFDFRLRTIKECGPIPCGQRLAWSCIFPIKPGVEVPPEGFLHLPQKQKFKATLFLEKKTIVMEKAAVALDGFGGGRISLGDESTVRSDEEFTAWEQFQTWDPVAALGRIQKHQPGPFDLDVEMQKKLSCTIGSWKNRRNAKMARRFILFRPPHPDPPPPGEREK